jgi:hypothetical protein
VRAGWARSPPVLGLSSFCISEGQPDGTGSSKWKVQRWDYSDALSIAKVDLKKMVKLCFRRKEILQD